MQAPNLNIGPASRKRTVLLVDDHPVVREGLTRRINSEDDLSVCAEARTPAEALRALKEFHPDVVVVDLALTEGHGLELIKDIRSQPNQVPILVFTMFEDGTYAMRALKAGAQGYLTKNETSERLVNGLRAVLKGEYVLNPDISTRFLQSRLQPGEQAPTPQYALADRELEVFELIGTGIGTRQIAAQLGRSVKTIETYRARIKEKLGLKSSTALMREAVRWVETRR
jgi:DNA-binding NarL/FixJ family response regulator